MAEEAVWCAEERRYSEAFPAVRKTAATGHFRQVALGRLRQRMVDPAHKYEDKWSSLKINPNARKPPTGPAPPVPNEVLVRWAAMAGK